MRVLRQKQRRKTLAYFAVVFGLRPPYRLLLDGNFLAVAARLALDWERLLPKLLQVAPQLCHLHVTECVLAELAALGPEHQAARDAAARVAVIKCRHRRSHGRGDGAGAGAGAGSGVTAAAPHAASTGPAECLARLIEGRPAHEGRWAVATQDAVLRARARAVPGTPVVLISSNVLVLEPPSAASRASAAQGEAGKGGLSREEASAVKAAQRALRHAAAAAAAPSASASASSASASFSIAASSSSSSRSAAAPPLWSLPAVRSDRPHAPRHSQPNPLSVKGAKARSSAAKRGRDSAGAVAAPAAVGGGGDGESIQGGRKRRRRGTGDRRPSEPLLHDA